MDDGEVGVGGWMEDGNGRIFMAWGFGSCWEDGTWVCELKFFSRARGAGTARRISGELACFADVDY